ncbi:MAG: hypothetical protein Q9217_001770 [Psora testacea]
MSLLALPSPPTKKGKEKAEAKIISGRMTAALTVYSGTFMRYALAVTPKNPLLFACHFVNFGAQLTQGYRFMQYWNYGGREAQLATKAKGEAKRMGHDSVEIAGDAKAGVEVLVGEARQKAGDLKERVVK